MAKLYKNYIIYRPDDEDPYVVDIIWCEHNSDDYTGGNVDQYWINLRQKYGAIKTDGDIRPYWMPFLISGPNELESDLNYDD